MNRRGITLIEVLIAVAILAIVTLMAVRLFPHILQFFQRYEVNNKLNTDSRSCMDVIVRAMQRGQPSTLKVCACGPTPCSTNPGVCIPPTNAPPNSRMEFSLPGAPPAPAAPSYQIYWEDYAVKMVETKTAPATTIGPRTLATGVSALIFNADFRDPGLVYVTLRIDAPLDQKVDAAGNLQNVQTVLIPNQMVRMTGTP